MRIVHCDTDDLENPLRGGQPIRTFQINRRLAERHDIQVFTATYRGSRRRSRREGVDYSTLGFGIPRFGLSHHLTFLAALGRAVRKSPHDIVVEEFTPPVGFCLLPSATRKPVVSIVQWFFFKHWERRYKLPFERIMRRLSEHVKERNFIVQSRCMARYFDALLPNARTHLIPCGLNAGEFSATVCPGEYALFLGRLDIAQKGLDTLLDAWIGLRAQGQAIPLKIAGAGPAADWLAERIRDAHLGDVVSMTGRVEADSKQRLLRDCRFLVMPSREETFGLTALEAMGCSKPVVAFDIDNLNEIVRPDWGVLARDAASLASAASGLWSSPAHCMDLGKNAYRKALDYSWDRLSVMQENLYKSIVGNGVSA